MIKHPYIDPVIVNIYGNFAITYYSLSYMAGIVLGWIYLKYLNKKIQLNLTKLFLDDIFTYSILGIIIGGRLGYVLFYNFDTYLYNPIEILKTWKGGMSFHGGMLGFIFSMFLICRKHKISFFHILDITSCIAPIGLFFGRIANFINCELYGKQTEVAWGVIFPNVSEYALHPSQIYEAILEGIIIFLIQNILLLRKHYYKNVSLLSALFLIEYSIFRFFVEFFREPDQHIGYICNMTMGQILSIPMFLLGCLICFRSVKR